VLLVSVVLSAIVANLFFETPNATGGGTAMMVGIIFLAIVFRAAIVFFLKRSEKRKDEKQQDKPAG
jgi:Na+/pantothenate symporter